MLHLRKKQLLLLCGLLFLIGPMVAQSAAPPAAEGASLALPVYDIVSIKPHKPGEDNTSVRVAPATYQAANLSVKDLLAGAYGVRNWLVYGLPAWAESGRFDIQAKISEPDLKILRNLTPHERNAMMIALMKDHLGLVVHQETKTLPLYELSLTPDGPKFHESPPLPPAEEGKLAPRRSTSMSSSDRHMTAKGTTMAAFAEQLAYPVERFIVDRTGLTGDYDLELKWTPEEQAGKTVDNGTGEDQPPVIFEALKEQLGLKLTPAKGPVPVIVVDHIDHPAAN